MLTVALNIVIRNEVELVRWHLDYHIAQGVDLFLVTDRGSDDGTLDVLREYESQGVVHLIREDADYFAQGEWLTRTARIAYHHYQADWIINVDTDEFLWPEEGDLRSTLVDVPEHIGVLRVPRANFVCRPTSTEPFFERMVLRDLNSENPIGESLPPKVVHRGFPDVTVDEGGHKLNGEGHRLCQDSDDLTVFHFPMRSFEQYERKIVTGTEALLRNASLPDTSAITWRRLYDIHLKGELEQYCAHRTVHDDAAQQAIAEGRLIEDKRFCEFLGNLGSS